MGHIRIGRSGGGGVATSAPKLIATLSTDVGTAVGDMVILNGTNSVTKITSNSFAAIPNGIFGVVTNKPSTIIAEVLFVGIQGGYTGLTAGNSVFINTSGAFTHTPPVTGMLQQVGFAVSTTEIFVNIQQALRLT